jgi:hypothetical protein
LSFTKIGPTSYSRVLIKRGQSDCHLHLVEYPMEENSSALPSNETILEEAKVSKEPLLLSDFIREFEGLDGPDDKLRFAMEGMRSALAQDGAANFKAFWEIRARCTELFKEAVNPALRAHYWAEYRELSHQAKQLKELHNSESTFASEQMEGAILGLEKEIASLGEAPAVLVSLESDSVVKRHFDQYVKGQSELSLLNAYTARIQALRKELIPLEIRIRSKNRFFEQLSALGDCIYPRRKELMQQMSDLFASDVTLFVERNFPNGEPQGALFRLRDEIKYLQGFAKQITLTNQVFSESRKRLSECWDLLREAGRRRKVEQGEKRELFKINLDLLLARLDELGQQVRNPEVASVEGGRALEKIMRDAKEIELGPHERNDFREKLSEVRQLHLARVKVEEAEGKRREEEHRVERVQKLALIEERLNNLEGRSELSTLQEELARLGLNSVEREALEQRLAEASEELAEREEAHLLREGVGLDELQVVLDRFQERRREMKNQLDELRKAGGSSGLDFERAMAYREAINRDRERLDRLDQKIAEVEERLDQVSEINS